MLKQGNSSDYRSFGSWLCMLMLFWPVASMADEASDMIRKVQDLLRADSSFARYSMTISKADWQRTLQFDSWDDRRHQRFFVRILSPRKDKDTTWLKDGRNLWMYIPRLERDIRIPPSMMLNAWMGSDFTNDDLVKMESVVDDYEHKIIQKLNHTITIESTPHPDAPVVWGKLVHRLSDNFIPLSVDYYDEHGKHVRNLHYREVKDMGGRRIPTVWVMQQLDGDEQSQTSLTVEKINFNIALDDRLFSRQNLK